MAYEKTKHLIAFLIIYWCIYLTLSYLMLEFDNETIKLLCVYGLSSVIAFLIALNLIYKR